MTEFEVRFRPADKPAANPSDSRREWRRKGWSRSPYARVSDIAEPLHSFDAGVTRDWFWSARGVWLCDSVCGLPLSAQNCCGASLLRPLAVLFLLEWGSGCPRLGAARVERLSNKSEHLCAAVEGQKAVV